MMNCVVHDINSSQTNRFDSCQVRVHRDSPALHAYGSDAMNERFKACFFGSKNGL